VRFALALTVALAGCGGEACPVGVELGDAESGCLCGDQRFEQYDNGEICSCEEGGLSCEGGYDTTSESSSSGCRGVGLDCG